MRKINMNAVACPGCGTSGAEHLNTDSQIEHTGRADGESWINCPDCGATCEFTEDGEVTMASGTEEFEWAMELASALDGIGMMDVTVANAA